ncbi:replication initiator protein A [Shimia sp. R11_0]|uniref:replication initiator protein A n=1 Tax=Shimia sp. R11_0 TaxID=2821096 RepID=UPI001AD9A2FA|nr:replication initiator protein A [Shimia sp. R11_0]MBO9479745.1 replication initiator protein A [Shimia sp. R11_0]
MREKQLLPVRHPQGELFLCDLGDVPLKDDSASMEHPIFALSTKPDTTPRVYEHNGNRVEITPSVVGLATIYDKDVLIFAISQIMEAKNQGLPYSREVSFNALDFLRFSNRMTNGQSYEGLRAALKRLRGTTITTDIVTGGVEQTDTFGLIEKSRIRRKLKSGEVTDWSITLSDWLFNAIEANEVLTLHPDYFRLRKPIERRVYEIVRKHCGAQKQWKVSIRLLLKKTGSQTTLKKFRQLLQPIMEADHLPDYSVQYEDETREMLIFRNRKHVTHKVISGRLMLQTETFAKAREEAPTWDVYFLEQEWRSWMNAKGMDPPNNPDKAFLGFCRSYFKKHGKA